MMLLLSTAREEREHPKARLKKKLLLEKNRLSRLPDSPLIDNSMRLTNPPEHERPGQEHTSDSFQPRKPRPFMDANSVKKEL